MGFQPHLAGERVTGAVEYRLQRQALLADVAEGVVRTEDVCDAHPELLRVARNGAPRSDVPCPICEDAALALVSYVFGPRLPRGGKVVLSDDELGRIAQRAGEFACYVVEVCPSCHWNHLLRAFPVGRDVS